MVARNILITFILSGIWHGANWTFILWGSFHGLILVIERNIQLNIPVIFRWLFTMTTVILLWALFRVDSFSDYLLFLSKVFTNFGIPNVNRSGIIFLAYFLFVDYLLVNFKREDQNWFKSKIIEYIILAFMLSLVLGDISTNPQFIYFQF